MGDSAKPSFGPPLLIAATQSSRPSTAGQSVGAEPAKAATSEPGTASPPKWKRFEELAAHIQRELQSANASVQTNERIVGTITEVPRELDITVRIPATPAPLLMVVDCKDYARPVDVKAVEAFLGLVEDVGANKGAMISAKGYTEAAGRRARAACVDLWTLVDLETVDWPAYVTIPVLVERVIPGARFQLSGTLPRDTPFRIYTLVLHDQEGRPLGTLPQLFVAAWNAGKFHPEKDEGRWLPLHDNAAFVIDGSQRREVRAEALFTCSREYFFDQVPLRGARGLMTIDGKLGASTITTENISLRDVEERWQRLESREALSVTPTLRLSVMAHIHETSDAREAAPGGQGLAVKVSVKPK